ncbi:MAG TPA: CCA tRNA nucleotidyltransferase [Fimbriimonas sp.]|nr:CCA tRNA nucleotidyltransferase [Fimbriimonas sp.]
MHPALEAIKTATIGAPFEGDLFIVGGAVRDQLLNLPHSADFDLVTRHSSMELAELLRPISAIAPVTYERFGTAMLQIEGAAIELVTARRESYETGSRKPTVEPATLEEDALRRDFTVNTLMRNLHTGQLVDPTGHGMRDLSSHILRTPLDPVATFHDDPLRMLRAVRFRWKLGFHPAEGLYESIRTERQRLRIVSYERIRDEFAKMLAHPSAPKAMADLMDLGLFEIFIPEFQPMVGCEQGKYHHLDVWNHTLAVLQNAGSDDVLLSLGALFHDVGKPPTKFIDAKGDIRFFGHEDVGAKMTAEILRRLKFPQRDIDVVTSLVRNHMRLGSSKEFTPAAARRLLRDLGDQTERLLDLVEADANGLRVGVKVMNLEKIRARLEEVQRATPVDQMRSPLTGGDIMNITGLQPGPEVGRIKEMLTEKVLEGELHPADVETARKWVRALGKA